VRLVRAHALTIAMFVGTVAWQFVYVTLPFHVHAISPYDGPSTLRWTGWILGIPSLVTVATAPFWGRWAERGDPKRLYVVVEMLQGAAFVAMAVARTLPELFVVRAVLGLFGAASTFAFVIAGRAPRTSDVRRHVAAAQSAMTIGQVLGPLAGALVAARLGFRPSFAVGAAMLVGCGLLVRWGVPTPPPRADARRGGRRASLREVAVAFTIILGGSAQVFFLPAILPHVVRDLGVDAEDTLTVSGFIISASGVAAALGSLAAPRLAEVVSERRLVATLLAASAALLLGLALAGSVASYGALRFFQVLVIAPVFPIIVARIAQRASGQAIGVVNSARIAAAFVGPVIATSLLSRAAAPAVYLVLATIALACVPLTVRRTRRGFQGGEELRT
jgi:DHA1 family multidrug resistance protein-like MFS transporter